MKIVDIIQGFSIAITNEENELLEWFDKQDKIEKQELTEHQQLIANQLVIKDLLIRKNIDGTITYKRSTR
jgi:hypothetical protein